MNKIKKNFVNTFIGSGISIIYSIIKGFLHPIFMSITDFATYKTIQLFSPFAGLTHLGIVDGYYKEVAGKDVKEIDMDIFNSRLLFLLLNQIFFVLPACIILYYFNPVFSLIPILFSLFNISTFFHYFFQSTSNFHLYRNSILLGAAGSTVFLVYIYMTDNFTLFYVLCLDILYVFLSALPGIYWYKKHSTGIKWKNPLNKNNFLIAKDGMIIFLANLVGIFFLQVDRWLVYLYFTTAQFAYYAFAVSILMIFISVTQSIQKVTFPLLAGLDNEDQRTLVLRDILIIVGSYFASFYFVLSYIVETFISEYNDSINIIAILFIGIPLLNVINGVFINLYKLKQSARFYLINCAIMLVISVVLNIIALNIYNKPEGIAIATTFSFFIWYVIASKQLLGSKNLLRDVVYLVLFTTVFIISINFSDNFEGFFISIIFTTLLILLFYKKILSLIFGFIFTSES